MEPGKIVHESRQIDQKCGIPGNDSNKKSKNQFDIKSILILKSTGLQDTES